MIYTCEKCHFIFERAGAVVVCPNCGKADNIREATEPERKKHRANAANDKRGQS